MGQRIYYEYGKPVGIEWTTSKPSALEWFVMIASSSAIGVVIGLILAESLRKH